MKVIVKAIDQLLRLFNRTITQLGLRKPVAAMIRGFTRILLTVVHWIYFRMTITGHSYIPKSGGVIIAPNHQSYLDPTLVALSIWRNVTFVSKRENFEVPILGPLIELGNAYPIERGGDDDALQFFEKLLKEGHCVIIFPEGTIPAEEDKIRSDVEPETGLLRGKTGAIRLALRAQVPIVPCGISGSGRALCPEAIPRGEKLPFPHPSKITIRFGKPLHYDPDHGKPFSKERLRDLTNALMLKISALVDHSMNFIPQEVPVLPKTYVTLRAYEEKTRPHPQAKRA